MITDKWVQTMAHSYRDVPNRRHTAEESYICELLEYSQSPRTALDKAERDTADARRWRWWREHATTRVALPMVQRSFDGDIPIDDQMLQWSVVIPGDLSTLFLSDPDRAIDAALAEQESSK